MSLPIDMIAANKPLTNQRQEISEDILNAVFEQSLWTPRFDLAPDAGFDFKVVISEENAPNISL